LLIAAVALVLVVPARGSPADDKTDAKPQKPGTRAEQYEALAKEYDKAMKDFQVAYSKATTNEQRRQVIAKMPKREKYSADMLKLAQDNPKDTTAVDAAVWVLKHYGSGLDKACDVLLGHAEDKRLSEVLETLGNPRLSAGRKLLQAVLEKNPDHNCQGLACFALAKSSKGEKADEYRERLLKEFADVKNHGGASLVDAINAPKFEKEHLVVGKTVPDIEGEDIDGKKFKLSDYRGKVVLLDFWGNW
jgi:hypothetical protein